MNSVVTKTERVASLPMAASCALTDLTSMPRVGFRGTASAAYLTALGYVLPADPNHATKQRSGEWIARLSASEFLILGAFEDQGARVAQHEADWALDERRNYLLPRQDSHAWLQLTGRKNSEVMAKLCGVDLSPEAFPSGAVAQTSAARITVTVINAGSEGDARFFILFDSASYAYFRHALVDAMAEFQNSHGR
ncbi:sarcosine oxidase subunit gamma [Pseudomonas entomophila]|uniref:sarcosine oxidase subunit gamma n=1 Tax=Pseudomonas entomophila TaxID=312306 RepID=UPI003EBEBFAA